MVASYTTVSVVVTAVIIQVDPWYTPQYFIPLGGMIAGNSMNAIAIALDQEEGIKIVHELVSNAQLFLCNLLPARQQKFGLDPETLFAINSKLGACNPDRIWHRRPRLPGGPATT